MITRMCVVCRVRIDRDEMLRLQCQNQNLSTFSGVGRSFYICKNCINDKKLDKILQRICKTDKNKSKLLVSKLKEMKIYED